MLIFIAIAVILLTALLSPRNTGIILTCPIVGFTIGTLVWIILVNMTPSAAGPNTWFVFMGICTGATFLFAPNPGIKAEKHLKNVCKFRDAHGTTGSPGGRR